MTLFDDDRYNWRETYFVYFETSRRPKLPEIRQALKILAPFLTILNSTVDEDDNLIAMTIASYEDHAALEITYQEGGDILAEAQHLFHTLKKEASAKEVSQLERMAHYKARFDVHHFEQTADTRVFHITKVPELKFPKQDTPPSESHDPFSKVLSMVKGKFHFDPDSYDLCRVGQVDDDSDSGILTPNGEDTERIDPEMLVTVLGMLCRLSRGVAIDPASGIVL